MAQNPVRWFEIHVQDMARAKKFYEGVFGAKLERLNTPGLEMWSFPMQMNQMGCAGALVKMEGGPIRWQRRHRLLRVRGLRGGAGARREERWSGRAGEVLDRRIRIRFPGLRHRREHDRHALDEVDAHRVRQAGMKNLFASAMSAA